jgi:hypothetical protein
MDTITNEDLAGQYLLDYADGEIGFQGKVLVADGQKFRVQMYSWRDGAPADVVTVTRAFIKKCRLFADRETWASAGVAAKAASADWLRWHRTEKPIAGCDRVPRQKKGSSTAVDLSVFE